MLVWKFTDIAETFESACACVCYFEREREREGKSIAKKEGRVGGVGSERDR